MSATFILTLHSTLHYALHSIRLWSRNYSPCLVAWEPILQTPQLGHARLSGRSCCWTARHICRHSLYPTAKLLRRNALLVCSEMESRMFCHFNHCRLFSVHWLHCCFLSTLQKRWRRVDGEDDGISNGILYDLGPG